MCRSDGGRDSERQWARMCAVSLEAQQHESGAHGFVREVGVHPESATNSALLNSVGAGALLWGCGSGRL
jgi:hypothetical protein